jgi:hypothetical protein
VELQDALVASEHDQLPTAPAGFEEIQLATGDLRHANGEDTPPTEGGPELASHRARVGPGRELE